jgi:hypothetical protein
MTDMPTCAKCGGPVDPHSRYTLYSDSTKRYFHHVCPGVSAGSSAQVLVEQPASSQDASEMLRHNTIEMAVESAGWYPPLGVCGGCGRRVYAGDPEFMPDNYERLNDRVYHHRCLVKLSAEHPERLAPEVCGDCAGYNKSDGGCDYCGGFVPSLKDTSTCGAHVKQQPVEIPAEAPMVSPVVPVVQATLGEWVPRLPRAQLKPGLKGVKRRDAGMKSRVDRARELRLEAVSDGC